MNSTPTKTEYIPSSTPINPLHDSGYVGSENKSVAKKLFHALSPIKEDPLRTKKICNGSDSGIFTSPPSIKSIIAYSLNKLRKIKNDDGIAHSPDVVRELKFNDSLDYTNESFTNEETKSEEKGNIITRFPLGSWRCVKLKVIENVCKTPHVREKKQLTRNKIDIFSQLKMRNCHCIISNVLSHLSAEDLCHVHGVCKTWQEIVKKDKDASARRKEFLKIKKSQLENQHKSRLSGTNDRYDRSTVLQKFVLGDVTNVTPVSKQDLIKQQNTRFDSFIREGQNLQNGSLMKCPKCSFAAKKQIEDEYICTECQHVFSKQSLYPCVRFQDSENLQVPNIVIGSKKSKRNLRRL